MGMVDGLSALGGRRHRNSRIQISAPLLVRLDLVIGPLLVRHQTPPIAPHAPMRPPTRTAIRVRNAAASAAPMTDSRARDTHCLSTHSATPPVATHCPPPAARPPESCHTPQWRNAQSDPTQSTLTKGTRHITHAKTFTVRAHTHTWLCRVAVTNVTGEVLSARGGTAENGAGFHGAASHASSIWRAQLKVGSVPFAPRGTAACTLCAKPKVARLAG
jgi:hypothetical protein